jgi:DNA repair photolyase
MPYDWDLNVYRGCGHGCKYCFALYSHQYINSNDYFNEIFVKTNIVEALERQLKSPSWKKKIINLGGVTDNYQPVEANYKLMPEVLKLMIKYKNPVVISSKSDLVLRDYDLIAELADITYVNVAATITAADENIRKLIEPNGVSSLRRFNMLKEFRKTNASVGMHVMPVIPFITDSYENLNSLFAQAKDNGIHYALVALLNLRGPTKGTFFEFIRQSFPHLYNSLLPMYKTGWVGKDEYKENLYKMVFEIRKKYSITNNYNAPMKEKIKSEGAAQLSLF